MVTCSYNFSSIVPKIRIISIFFAAIFVGASQIAAFAFPIVSPECKPDPIKCAKEGKLDAVEIYSVIRNEDYDFFQAIDEAIPEDKPFPKVYLNSEGGSSGVGQYIGKILRKRKATVIGGSPFIPDRFVECSSACVFIAAGATTRYLNHIGVHQGHYTVSYGKNTQDEIPVGKDKTEEAIKFLIDMGIDSKIGDVIRNTPFNRMSDFYFDPSTPSSDQDIVKFGFHMEGTPLDTVIKMPIDNRAVSDNHEARLHLAIDYGSIDAIHELVNEKLRKVSGKEPNYGEAIPLLQIGADRNDVYSLHNLGYYSQYGIGTKKDPKKSAQYFLKAAKLGFAGSQNNIGWAYYKGEGVKKSIPDAVYWITRSAEQGEPFAYGSLCEMHAAGDVFQRDDLEAYKWCKLAVDQEPKGKARDNDVILLERYTKKMSSDDLAKAQVLIDKWAPLKQATSKMSDVEDE